MWRNKKTCDEAKTSVISSRQTTRMRRQTLQVDIPWVPGSAMVEALDRTRPESEGSHETSSDERKEKMGKRRM